MVKGLDVFREHFRDFADRYLLIGGTACDLLMSAVGVEFRATKDLDIVLCVEALDSSFVQAFWAFVRAGEYQVQENSTGHKQFYRFQKPKTAGYPHMLELFSRIPDALQVAAGSHLAPLPMEEDVSPLSIVVNSHGLLVPGQCRSGQNGPLARPQKAWPDRTTWRLVSLNEA